MKILVIDDNWSNLEAAEKMEGDGHEVVVISTFKEAAERLEAKTNDDKVAEIMAAAGFEGFDIWAEGVDKEKKKKFRNVRRAAWKEAEEFEHFDIVLVDMLMPAEKDGQGDKGRRFVGDLVPYGFPLTILAMNAGVKKIAMVSDGNHHDHPLMWACDSILGADLNNGQVQFFCNHACPLNEDGTKDWAKVVRKITSQPEPEEA